MHRWIRKCIWLMLSAGGLLAASLACALDPDRTIGQLTHVWYENQLLQGTVLSIAQRSDGSLWLATYGGLVHYSGAEFDTIDPRVAPVLKSTAITSVYAGPDGTLWVGTLNDGLYRIRRRGVLERVAVPASIRSVFGIVQSKSGALWLTTNAGVARMDAEGIRLLDEKSGFPPRGFYRAIVADAAGGVWIAADGVGVIHWHDGRAETVDTQRGLPTNAVYSLAISHDGVVWVGTEAGPARYRNGRFEADPRAAALAGKRIFSLFGDRDGSMWFAPLGMGLCRLTRKDFECDNSLRGMVGETVRTMFEDHEGNLWMGTTSSGIQRFSDSKLVTVTGKMNSNAIRAVYQDAAGTLWVGTDGAGLARYQQRELVPVIAINQKLPSLLVRAIIGDAAGNLWVGSTEGVSRISPSGSVRNFGIGDGLPGTIVFAFAADGDDGMWVATLQGLARIDGDKVTQVPGTRGDDIRSLYSAPDGRLWIGERNGLRCLTAGVVDRCGTDGLPGTSVFAFHAQANGDLWLGTGIGLMRLRGGKVQSFTQRAGFYGDAVFALLDDDAGNFWMSSNRGIARLARSDLHALGRGSLDHVQPRWYGRNDGMLSQQANGASQTPAWRTRDGRMWFGTAHGVVMVDPSHEGRNAMPPPVAIERLLVDGQDVDPHHATAIGPSVDRIELHYAAMSYVAPAAVRYRYRLQGFDRRWIEAGDARVAYYTNLPAGDYVFQVIASNNDGVWNTTGASVTFTILTTWYASWWFRTLGALVILGLLGLIYWLRVCRLKRRERDLMREVAQRTAALRAANTELKRLAALDGLTHIANHAAFSQQLRIALSDHAARGDSLAVLMCDVDAFKAYNDTYGHLAGDLALTAVAGALTSVLRSKADLAARYGGEEFAVLLANCNVSEAVVVARRLLDAVRGLAIAHSTSDTAAHVTISIGMAARVPNGNVTPEQFLNSADEALYRAKAQGRDRMVGGVESDR